MMRSAGNGRSGIGRENGVSSKIFQEGQVVDLGLKLLNQSRPFLSDQGGIADDGDGDGRIGVGPTCNGYSCCGMNIISDDIYDVASASASASAYSPSPGLRGLQPFHVSCLPHPAYPLLKPSGGMATTATGFPFTAAQWKELERQAMIYKYMVASLPVPPDLLYASLPTNLCPSTFGAAHYLLGKYENGLNLSWSGNSKDAEPGRCKRTDGKKWRCSRDVAPNHKYCERHMHRGRPRSRKPVELLPHHSSLPDFPTVNSKNDNNNKNNNNNPIAKKSRLDGSSPQPQPVGFSLPLISPSKDSAFGSSANPYDDSRSVAWNEEQHWQQMMQANVNSLTFSHQYEGVPLNLNLQVDFSSSSDMGLLERPFIDAWSMEVAGSKDNGGYNKSSVTPLRGIHGHVIDKDNCQIQMDLGAIDSWVAPPVSPGGPLAEVLRPGTSQSPLNRAASDAGERDLVTLATTAVSSPSGVLQKNPGFLSDSSGNSSPTCQNSSTKSDMPFHWLN